MRKLIILAMVLAMILGLTPAYAAEGSLKLTAEAPDSSGVMYVTLSLSGDISGDTMGLEFSYDKAVLEVVNSGCNWSAKGVLQDINTKRCEGVWAADKSKKLDGSICVLAFRVRSGATLTSTDISCSVVVKNGAKQVGEYSDTVTLQKECAHTYGEWTSLKSMGHTRKCTLCGQGQVQSHEWNEGTVTADPDNPGRNIRTRTCTVCKDTRQDFEYVEPTATSEGRNEHTNPSENVPETTTRVPNTMPPTSEEQTYPKSTQPAQTDPEPTTPTASKPEPTVPTESKPGATAPGESKPGQEKPTENRPETTMPGQGQPEATSPTESRPEPTVPTENHPEPTRPTANDPEHSDPMETRPQPTEEGKGEGDTPTAGTESMNPVNPGNPNPETPNMPNTPQSGQIGTGSQQPGQSGDQQGNQQPGQSGDQQDNQQPGQSGDQQGNQQPGQNGGQQGNQQPGQNGNQEGNQQQNNTPQQGVIGPGYENSQQNGNPEKQETQPGEDPHDHGDALIGEVHGDHVHLPNGETVPQIIPAPNAPDTTNPGENAGTEAVETEPAENNRNGLLLAALLLVWAAAGGVYVIYRRKTKKK